MRSAAGLSLLGAAGVLLTVSSFFGGGSGQQRLFWIAAGAVLVALAAATASLTGFLPAPSGPTSRLLGPPLRGERRGPWAGD